MARKVGYKRWNPGCSCCYEEPVYDPCFACGNCPQAIPDTLFGMDTCCFIYPTATDYVTRYPSFEKFANFCFLYTAVLLNNPGVLWTANYTMGCLGDRAFCTAVKTLSGVTVYQQTAYVSSLSCNPISFVFPFPSQAAVGIAPAFPAHNVYVSESSFL
jgi:hypothetical protein